MIISTLDRCPPCLCRLLARKKRGHVAMSHRDIARVSGLALTTIVEISFKTTWSGLTVDTIERFCQACGVNPLQPSEHMEFMRKSEMKYATNCETRQRSMFSRLFALSKDAIMRQVNKSKPKEP